MAVENASRTLNLADVLTRIASVGVSDKKRAELCSSIRAVGRALNRPLDQISADPRSLRRRLNDMSAASAGVSHGRWANVRSDLRTALRLTDICVMHKTRLTMSPQWKDLFEQLPNRSARIRLSRLLRHLSNARIDPPAVSGEYLETFGALLLDDPLIKDPGATWRETAGAWNSARDKIDGWPDVAISIPCRRQTYTLPPSAFPASFKVEVEAYLKRIAGTDLLEEIPFRPVRASTCKIRERQLYVAASALVHRGHNPNTIQSLADLVCLENYKEVLRFLVERRGNKSSSAIENLARFLKSVAQHWVRTHPLVLEQMAVLIKTRLTVPQRGMTVKNRERLRPFQDKANADALLKLPQRLMAEAVSGRHHWKRSALLAQSSVAIELLLIRPLRIKNLVNLELEKDLIPPGGKCKVWYIQIPESEVKNDFYLEHEIPAESAALLERYLRDFRPMLAKEGNPALFPGKYGVRRKSKNTLAGQIAKTVLRYTGCRANPQLFRHLGALFYLNEHPGEYGVLSQVLAHKSPNTTKKYYTGLEGDAAFRRWGKTISDLRSGSNGTAQSTTMLRGLRKRKG